MRDVFLGSPQYSHLKCTIFCVMMLPGCFYDDILFSIHCLLSHCWPPTKMHGNPHGSVYTLDPTCKEEAVGRRMSNAVKNTVLIFI